MSQRFFVENLSSEVATLAGPEAHHLIHVMRAAAGDEVVLFDGSGDEAVARVEKITRSQAALRVVSRRTVDRELALPLTLGVALPKGDRQRWLIEKAVELGVSRLVPLASQRSVAAVSGGTLTRLRRAAIEASKQCGRNRLMEITPTARWEEFIGRTTPRSAAGIATRCWLAHPGGEPIAGVLGSANSVEDAPHGFTLAIGPEGGLSDAEVALAIDANWQAIDLGPRILRVETAATLLVAMATLAWQRPPLGNPP